MVALLAITMLLSMVIALHPVLGDSANPPGTHMPTFAYLNVFPNPAGIGQQVTLGIFLATPYPTGEVATPFYVNIVKPNGNNDTLGPYTSDTTEGTVAYFTPDTVGNYTIQFFFKGQTLTNGMIADASTSLPTTLVVQQEPNIGRAYPYTPLPTTWWETPVSAENSQLLWSELDFPVISQQIAYGVVTSLNCYDEQVYAFGKGPSMTTVTAPNVGVTTETPITITGTVTDVSAGVSQSEVAKNYPNGLPCVSDESQSKFMEYVYQDQPMPSNATGVSITISVSDSNNNFRAIGTTTSNVYGTYSLTWTPDIPGDYTVISSFAGSNSYYPSSSATAFHASSPVATPTTTTVPVLNFATTSDLMLYIVGAAVAIIIAIAIVGILLLRKRP